MITNQGQSIMTGTTDREIDKLLIALSNCYKIYRSNEIETVALRGVDLSLYENEIVGCIGPSGSGKTTLVKLMTGLIKPTAGIVYWSVVGGDISRLNDRIITQVRNRFIGIISQLPNENIIPYLSVIENVTLQGRIGRLSSGELKKTALELLKIMGLKRRANSSVMKLSGGEKQRVALASALITNPSLIVADEPTGNLDYSTGEELLELVETINADYGTTFFIVTHSQQVLSHLHRAVEIRDGIIAGHHRQVDVDNLNKSRIISIDEQGRILLPKELINSLTGDKKHFTAVIDDNRIILEPLKTRDIIDKRIILTEKKTVICPVCNSSNPSKNLLCHNCGSLLRKAGKLRN